MKIPVKPLIFILILVVANIVVLNYVNSAGSQGASSLTSVDLDTCSLVELDDDRISLTIPSDYVYDATQEDLDTACEAAGYESITLNSDGSATYVLTKEQHKQMLTDLATGLSDTIEGLPGNSPFKDVTSVEYSDDFTEYKIYTDNTDADFDTSMIVINLKMYSTMYCVFAGINDQNIHFDFYNKNNEAIATLDSNIAD